MTADRRQSSLLPFRGLRFTSDLDGGLGGTLGPPADIDSSEAARAFVAGHPFNAVRLEIEDDVGALRFRTARELLCRWRRDDVLTAEPHPSYYVYEQAFDDHGEWRARRGILGLVPVDALPRLHHEWHAVLDAAYRDALASVTRLPPATDRM